MLYHRGGRDLRVVRTLINILDASKSTGAVYIQARHVAVTCNQLIVEMRTTPKHAKQGAKIGFQGDGSTGAH